MAWSRLTHQLHQDWAPQGLAGQRLLLLFSGGADSLALFFQLQELSRALKYEFEVAHFHHGAEPSGSEPFSLEAGRYREEAAAFCQRHCERAGLRLHQVRAESVLQSEEQMRDFRREGALRLQRDFNFDRLVTAHQADDVLETRLFRVMRGTGVQGLRAMRSWAAPWWKPLLSRTRRELLEDLAWRGESPLEDPSNGDLRYRRNWIRQGLLPQMEAQMPGSVAHLARFLSQVVDASSESLPASEQWVQSGIPRSWFLQQSASEQKRALASYLFELGVQNYAHTQIDEVRKQLDNPKIVHTLRTAGCDWFLNQDTIYAVPQEKP